MATEKKKKKKGYTHVYPTLSQEEKLKEYEELTTKIGTIEKKREGYLEKIEKNKKARKDLSFLEKAIPVAVCTYICGCMAFVAPAGVFLFFATICTMFLERKLHVIKNTFNRIKAAFAARKMKKLEKQRSYLQECYKSADKAREDLGLNNDKEITEDKAHVTTIDNNLETTEEVAQTEEKTGTVKENNVKQSAADAQKLVDGLTEEAAKDADNLAGLYKESKGKDTSAPVKDTGKE